MNIQEIEKLLERYFEGQTTLEEERALKAFFSSGDVPAKLRKYQAHFKFLVYEAQQDLEDPGFDARINERIEDKKIIKLLPQSKKSLLFWISGIAAGVALLVTVFLKSDPYVKQIESTYTDPELAYNEAKKVLLFVSSKFNNGTKELEKLGKMEQATAPLGNISKFDQGIETASSTISKYNKIGEIINP